MKAILGRKMGMTEVFAEDGTMYPVTVVEVLPNVVTQVKTLEKDGYVAVQVGYEEKKESRANKCELGIAKKAGTVPHLHSSELRGDEMTGFGVSLSFLALFSSACFFSFSAFLTWFKLWANSSADFESFSSNSASSESNPLSVSAPAEIEPVR